MDVQEKQSLDREHAGDLRDPEKKDEKYDYLTGCLTLQSFRKTSESLLKRLNNQDKKDVVFFNIVNFKAYNEEFGFDNGNNRISELADLIRETFPDRAVARAYGDQFYALVYDSELKEGISHVSERFRREFPEFQTGLKIGVCAVEGDVQDFSVCCDRAKTAGDSIKKQYGVLYHVYDEEMDRMLSQKRYIIENIDRAISEDQIVVYYQPVIRTLTNEVCGMEALARWDDPEKGLIMPQILIDTLEDVQMINKLDTHIIELVCRDYERAKNRGEELVPISFNLSRLDFELCDIFQIVDDTVRRHNVPKSMIHVEITESVFTRDPNFIKKYIRKFHDAGYEVWMDDFGSGYSSLNTMKDYDFDVIKIDMLFLRTFNIKAKKIIMSIIDMAKRIGIRTLAEGVETAEQLDFLRNAGCEKVQGYLIGRPQPYRVTRMDLVNAGYLYEKEDMRLYYDNLGLVNLLSTRPLEYDLIRSNENELSEDSASGIPIILFELVGERFHILQTNRAFRKVLGSFGVFSPRAAEFDMNDRSSGVFEDFRKFLGNLRKDRHIDSFSFIVNGNYCYIRGRCTSEIEGRSAYVATIENLSGSRETGDNGKLAEVMPVLCNMFDMITTFSPEDDTEEIVYINSYFTANRGTNNTMSASVENFMTSFIHPDDAARFRQTLDMQTITDRVACCPNGELDVYFRVRDEDRSYKWKMFTFIMMQKRSTTRILLCIYDAGSVQKNPYEYIQVGSMKPSVMKNLHDLSTMRRRIEVESIREQSKDGNPSVIPSVHVQKEL